MIEKIIQFSIKQRTFVVLAALLLVVGGVAAALRLPIDAIPDITNKQVELGEEE